MSRAELKGNGVPGVGVRSPGQGPLKEGGDKTTRRVGKKAGGKEAAKGEVRLAIERIERSISDVTTGQRLNSFYLDCG